MSRAINRMFASSKNINWLNIGKVAIQWVYHGFINFRCIFWNQFLYHVPETTFRMEKDLCQLLLTWLYLEANKSSGVTTDWVLTPWHCFVTTVHELFSQAGQQVFQSIPSMNSRNSFYQSTLINSPGITWHSVVKNMTIFKILYCQGIFWYVKVATIARNINNRCVKLESMVETMNVSLFVPLWWKFFLMTVAKNPNCFQVSLVGELELLKITWQGGCVGGT